MLLLKPWARASGRALQCVAPAGRACKVAVIAAAISHPQPMPCVRTRCRHSAAVVRLIFKSPGDLLVLLSLRRRQNNAATPDHLPGCRTSARPFLQPGESGFG